MNAKELAETSLRLTREGDREGWLALFTPEAVLEDPVGAGEHRGLQAITLFRDTVIATMDAFDYEIERCYACGEEAALVVTFHITAGGNTMDMDLVNIYKASADGRLVSLRSFWDGSRQGR